MKRQISQRLGSGAADADPIKTHPFFKHIKWADVISRKLDPPFKPVLASDDDVSQFDSNFTKQTPVDSPCGASLSESVNLVFQVGIQCCKYLGSQMMMITIQIRELMNNSHKIRTNLECEFIVRTFDIQ